MDQNENLEERSNSAEGFVWLSWRVMGPLAGVLIYVLSYGPVLYVLARHPGPAWVSHAMEFVYKPHTELAYHSEGYYKYMCWCVGANFGTHEVYREFKDSYEPSN